MIQGSLELKFACHKKKTHNYVILLSAVYNLSNKLIDFCLSLLLANMDLELVSCGERLDEIVGCFGGTVSSTV